jgi:hypothetical protein
LRRKYHNVFGKLLYRDIEIYKYYLDKGGPNHTRGVSFCLWRFISLKSSIALVS